MAPINNKRKADDNEHKTLVIENLEFCMLQFYKSQFEAAQGRIHAMERANKKLKRDNDHKDQVIHAQQETIDELMEQIEWDVEIREGIEADLEQAETIAEGQQTMLHFRHQQLLNQEATLTAITNEIDHFATDFPNDEHLQVLKERTDIIATNYDSDATQPDINIEI